MLCVDGRKVNRPSLSISLSTFAFEKTADQTFAFRFDFWRKSRRRVSRNGEGTEGRCLLGPYRLPGTLVELRVRR